MSTALQFTLARAQVIDPRTGALTRAGVAFFEALWRRAGGATGPSTTELQTLLEQAAAGLQTQIEAETLTPAVVPVLLPDDVTPAALSVLPGDDLAPALTLPLQADDLTPARALERPADDVMPAAAPPVQADDLTPLPAQHAQRDDLGGELAALREEVAALRRVVEALEIHP